MPATKDSTASKLVLRIATLDRLIDDATSVAAKSRNIGRPALAVLCELDVNGASRPGQLHAVTGFTSGGVSRCLDGLAEQGLVRRTYGSLSDDRRGVQVVITPKGRELVRRFASELDARLVEEGIDTL